MDYKFDAVRAKNECVTWIKDYFSANGPTCNAVIGISGGKDSTIVAALCVEALGKERVIGVLMPQGIQSDFSVSKEVVELLDIKSYTINIVEPVFSTLRNMNECGIITSTATRINLPARIRMSTLFAIAQSCNGRVANTSNLSEDWIGWATLFGDSVGQFSPLSALTVTEVKAIGVALGLPSYLVDKSPADGLTGKTDEDNFGFTYDVLDRYIRTMVCDDVAVKEKIDMLHAQSRFKFEPMPIYRPDEGCWDFEIGNS